MHFLHKDHEELYEDLFSLFQDLLNRYILNNSQIHCIRARGLSVRFYVARYMQFIVE